MTRSSARTRLAAAAGIIGLAILAGCWLWLADPEDAEPARLSSSTAMAPAEPEAETTPSLPQAGPSELSALVPHTANGESTTGTALSSASQLSGLLTGRLVHEDDGSPVPDAEILLFTEGMSGDSPPTGFRTDVVHTDATGAFSVNFAQHATLWLLRALPGPGHALVEERPELVIPPGETHSIELRALRGGSVSGVVVDEMERPVAGATVLMWSDRRSSVEFEDGPPAKPHARVATDSAGRFVAQGAGPWVLLMPEMEGLAAWRGAHGPLPEGETVSDIKLVVGPGYVIRGRVVDSQHRPVPPVWVVASRVERYRSVAMMSGTEPLNVAVATDANGRFALPRVASRRWHVSVKEPSHQPYERLLEPDDPVLLEREDLLIELAQGCHVEGIVTGADGSPLDQAAVLLFGASEASEDGPTGSTWIQTTAGRFAFDNLLPTDGALLSVTAEGHAAFLMEPLVVSASPGAPLAIQLERELTISGQVVDEQGQPVPGALLKLSSTRRAQTGEWIGQSWDKFLLSWLARQTSDAEGRFHFGRLYEGNFELLVEDPRNLGLKQTLTVAGGDQNLLVRLDASAMALGTLSGNVRDAATGAPLDAFQIWAFKHSLEGGSPDSTRSGSFTDAGGRYSVHGFTPGLYAVYAKAEGYARWSLPELSVQLGEQPLDINLFRERTLRLRVADQEGEPVYQAAVLFENERGQRFNPASQPQGDGTHGETDIQGEIFATGLPADRIVVVLKYALVKGTGVGMREHRTSFDLRVQPEGTQVIVVQRPVHRWLVVSPYFSSENSLASVRDTADSKLNSWFAPLFESGQLRLPDLRVECTVQDDSGAVIDSASCEPAGADGRTWRLSSSAQEGEESRGPWLLARLPAGAATVEIRSAGTDPVRLEIPAGEDDVKRVVVLVPAAQ
ncbi:MAG: carboxypeptidase regulatory-like domain-containing protein [Planctomycetota bacterium]